MHLKILSDDEKIASICEDYWKQNETGEFVLKTNEVASLHSVKGNNLPTLIQQHSYVWLDDIACGQCGQPYRFSTRSQYQGRHRLKGLVCSECIDAERRAIAEEKKSLLSELRQTAIEGKQDLQSLGFKEKAYLVAAVSSLGNEQLTAIYPLNTYPLCTLSPDRAYDESIIRHLSKNNCLIIDPSTRPDAVQYNDDGSASLALGECFFEIAYDTSAMGDLFGEFLDEGEQSEIKSSDAFSDLCKEVQLNECLAFLKTVLENHRLRISPGQKTRLVLNECLEHFSVAQVYNFIWRAVKDAAAYYMRENVGRGQAANSVVGNISRSRERALANGWEIKPFRRNYNLPQSSLSRLLFNVILGTDDGGFKYPLHALLGVDAPGLR